ncbi:MAG TPA: hypothetical protein VE983_12685 [Solirubrobacteraceae bacterium]|nr:hypothetical protein [Solirubrobacteraceae bacterium]
MTRPAPSSKVVLLEDRRGGSDLAAGAPLRRFRLARMRFEGAPVPADCRYEYLKQAHD